MPRCEELGFGLAITTLIQWSAFIVASRRSNQNGLTPFDIEVLRISAAAAALYPWWIPRFLNSQLPGLPLHQSITFSALAGVTYPLSAYWGFHFAAGAHAAVLISRLLPSFGALFAGWLLKEVPKPINKQRTAIDRR